MKTSTLLKGNIAAAGLLLVALLAPQGAVPPQWVASLLVQQATGAFPRRNVADGTNADWLVGLWTPIGNTSALVSNGVDTEFLWRDKVGDARIDHPESADNWDLEAVRIIADTENLYLLVQARNMWNNGLFGLSLAIDSDIAINPLGGTTGMNWIGGSSVGAGVSTLLASSRQYSEINVDMDLDGTWFYRGSGWYDVPATSWNWIIDAQECMEVKLKWSDMGFTSVPSRLRFTLATFKRNAGANPKFGGDVTTDLFNSDFVDAASWGVCNSTDEWQDELSDGNISTCFDVAFDATGNCINPRRPAAPQNLRAFDGTVKAWFTTGESIATNNPLLAWDPVPPDGDAGDTIVGYYIQVSTSSAVDANGFFYGGWAQAVQRNTHFVADNQIIYWNNYTAQPWWGKSDSSAGVSNSSGLLDTHPILVFGQTYYVRVWARDARGMLGAPSATYVLPVDYPAWHDPYVFSPLVNGGTFRKNRDPKEGDDVNFIVGTFDPAPYDPRDSYFENPWTANQWAPNEILNVILHIRVARVGSATYDWATQAAKIILGNEWRDANGNIAWYLPQSDPPDSYSYWETGGDPDPAKTWVYKCMKVNLGNNGDARTFKLNSTVGDTIEYFFEINNGTEAPGSYYPLSAQPRRFLHAYDANGITGYRFGTEAEARSRPFRFIVQKRDLTAVWHNPLSNEVPLGAGGIPLMMRNPPWPDTGPQNVRMYVGVVGTGSLNWQMVWRDLDSGTWVTSNFSGGAGVQTDTNRHIYYHRHDFNYTGGMIEYYFKTNADNLFIFANGITDNRDTVYDNSVGPEGKESVPFRFPFTSRVKVTSSANFGKDTHSMVAILGFRAPRFDAMDENAVGVNGILNFGAESVVVTGNVFTNAFPGVYLDRPDTPGAREPRRLFGRSYAAMMAGVSNAVTGLRKAFFGPISPFDYGVTDSSKWNTGSDAYENVPVLTFNEVFSDAVEKTEPAGTTFNAGTPLEGVIHVPGAATIATINITRGALIADTITIASGAVVTATRLDLCSLSGPVRVLGRLTAETGILFSNQSIQVETGAVLRLRKLGSLVAQNIRVDSGAVIEVRHPAAVGFLSTKESVISRATRWVISSLRESR